MAKIPALQKLTHMRDLWDLQVVRKMYHHLSPSHRRAKGQLFHFSRGQIFLLLEGFLEVADLLQAEALTDSDYLSLSRYLSFSVLGNRLLSDI